MYGGLAHANNDKYPQYEALMQGPFASAAETCFADIAANIMHVIGSFYKMNERTIQMLEETEA